jgi:hypothetical protein
VNYTQGAVRYAAQTIPGGFGGVNQFNGGSLGYGFFSDGVVNTQTGDVQLTTAIGVNAAYDHLWTPQLRTSVYGSWLTTRYSDAANTAICNAQTNSAAGAVSFQGGIVAPGPAGALLGSSTIGGCSNNWNLWMVGSRSQYNFTPWFYVGFDVLYAKIETASNGAIVTYTTNTAKPTALYSVTNQDNYGLRIRVHRDLVP